MTLNVLVVDDSGFFRRRVTDIIDADPRMKVVGVAENGRDAIELNEKLKPDVVTMDYEMPVMDGITAVRQMMASRRVPVLMFSSLTFEGARVTLDALDAGAVDFLPKNFDAISRNTDAMRRTLTDKIVAVAHSHQTPPATKAASTSTSGPVVKKLTGLELVVIGTSTGGPAALQSIFRELPGDFRTPIVIVQHMPASFTAAFAERLNNISGLTVREAKNGDILQPGTVYVAPGGRQLMLDKRGGGSIHILDSDNRVHYRPSVDIAFASAAKHFGRHALGIVLTGMGSDGREGARLIKDAGGHIWAQDEESSVIFGMPMAVIRDGLADQVLPLTGLGRRIASA